jgi:hypothetical protein
MVGGELEPESLSAAEAMDCLKLEFTPKKELWKEDVARLNAAGFKPTGKGAVWPQFRATEPGWHPWHVTQREAEQLLADLPRLTAFCKMFEENPELYDGRTETEIPFLPANLPERALTPADLDWHSIVLPPEPALEAFRPSPEELEQLLALKGLPAVFEFDSIILPGASLLENGRPCFGRISLLVETQRGLVLGAEIHAGPTPAAEAAGRALVKGLRMAGGLPKKVRISGSQLMPALEPFARH